jgi:hypothetical protein
MLQLRRLAQLGRWTCLHHPYRLCHPYRPVPPVVQVIPGHPLAPVCQQHLYLLYHPSPLVHPAVLVAPERPVGLGLLRHLGYLGLPVVRRALVRRDRLLEQETFRTRRRIGRDQG